MEILLNNEGNLHLHYYRKKCFGLEKAKKRVCENGKKSSSNYIELVL